VVDILGKLAVAVFVLYVWVVWHHLDSAVDTPALICMWNFSLNWVRLDLVVHNLVVACMLSSLRNGVHLDLAVHNLADPLRTVCVRTRFVAEGVMFVVVFRARLWELDGECGGLEW
jgi:hypothetical protein